MRAVSPTNTQKITSQSGSLRPPKFSFESHVKLLTGINPLYTNEMRLSTPPPLTQSQIADDGVGVWQLSIFCTSYGQFVNLTNAPLPRRPISPGFQLEQISRSHPQIPPSHPPTPSH